MNSIHVRLGNSDYWTNDGTERGFMHRTDGPAVVSGNGLGIEWYFEGNWYKDFNEWCLATNQNQEDKLFLKLKYQIK